MGKQTVLRHARGVIAPGARRCALALGLVFLAAGQARAQAVQPNYYAADGGGHGRVSYSPAAGSGAVYGFHSSLKSAVQRLNPARQGGAAPVTHGLVSYENPIVAASVNTDYKTRPASAAIPHYVRGKGIGGQNLPLGLEEQAKDRMPPDYMPTDLVLFPREYSYYRQPAWLRQEVADAGLRLIKDAEREGLTLRVFSAYRDYSHQSRLKKGGGVVASAGASQHQYGTTMDVTRDEKTLMKKSFAGTPEGQWLRKNAYKYGFRATVVRDRGTGEEVVEPWHLRYFGPGNAGGPDTRPIAGTTMIASKKSSAASRSRQTVAASAPPAPAPQATPQPSRFSLKRLLPGHNPQ